MTSKHVAFATCRQMPTIKSDEQPVVHALAERGVKVESVFWDQPGVRWEKFDAVVIRTCWDYHLRLNEFLGWVNQTTRKGARFWNSPDILRWNSSKRYLKELQACGVNTIPTEWIDRGSAVKLDEMLLDKGWSEAVVKPVISACAYQTWRTSLATAPADQTRLNQMVAQADLMLQPFMPEITSKGEWSMIFFQGQFSHAVVKKPQAGDFRVQPDHGGSSQTQRPSATVIQQAKKIVDTVGCPLLYARVDGIEIDGQFFLMELELLEPDLFLSEHDQSDHRFAEAILNLVA